MKCGDTERESMKITAMPTRSEHIENSCRAGATNFLSHLEQRGALFTDNSPSPIKYHDRYRRKFAFQKVLGFSVFRRDVGSEK